MISFVRVTKRFGSVHALRDVSFECKIGSVHAVTGENGAGKSTLMNLLAGLFRADGGEILLRGKPIAPESPRQAQQFGISTIFQELTLLPNLTIAENMFLGRAPVRRGVVDRGQMRDRAAAALARLGSSLNVDTICGDLSIADQQLVEIAKGIATDADVFIFDEPTAALNAPEVEKLGGLIASLKAANKLIFYVSHRLDEIFRFCDQVTVLKDGGHVVTRHINGLSRDDLVSLMVGRVLSQFYPPRPAKAAGAPVALRADDFQVEKNGKRISFALFRGEILGLAGLEGQGQRDIIRAIAGLEPAAGGRVTKGEGGNARLLDLTVVGTVRAGVGFVPEDRKSEGLYLSLSIASNIALGTLRRASIWRMARIKGNLIAELMERMQIRATGAHQAVGLLSGGNQQKVMIGRWLASGVDVLLLEEPTRGVDVGAKAEIYTLIRDFADQGGAVLMTSSELQEVLGFCDRIMVVRQNEIVTELEGISASEEEVMRHALTGRVSPQPDLQSHA